MQLSPNLRWLKAQLDIGLIGELLQIDAFGKMDRRAGGEDMSVLGGHVFDLCRLFAGGDAQWCTARTPLIPALTNLSLPSLSLSRVLSGFLIYPLACLESTHPKESAVVIIYVSFARNDSSHYGSNHHIACLPGPS